MRIELDVLEARRSKGAVTLRVAIAFLKDGSKAFELDKVSVCDGGEACR